MNIIIVGLLTYELNIQLGSHSHSDDYKFPIGFPNKHISTVNKTHDIIRQLLHTSSADEHSPNMDKDMIRRGSLYGCGLHALKVTKCAIISTCLTLA